MPKYIFNGKEFSEDEVFNAAEKSGLSVTDYISQAGIEVIEDQPVESFITDPAKETADVGSEMEAVDMESQPEDGSLDLQKSNEISTWQSIKNSFSNLGEQIGDVVEFWGADEGAGSGLDIATHAIYETIFGRENIERFIEFAGEDSFWTRGLGVKETKQAINKFEKEKEESLQTKGIIESLKEGDMGGVAAGIINGVTSGVGSAAYMFLTGGAGFASEYIADSYVEYNKIKAENEGKTLKQLIDEGEESNAVPVAMGAVMTGLERIGFGAIQKGMTGAIKGSSGKTFISSLSKDMAEKVFYNKGSRATAKIISTGATEFTTEVLQNAAEEVNKELGRIASTDREEKILESTLDVGKAFVDAVFSEESLEAGLQGAFGGGGMVAGSYSAKAMATVRKAVSQVDVNDDLNLLADKRKAKEQAKTKLAKDGIQLEIDKIEMRLSDAIQQGNDLYNSLTDGQISEIENLTDLADAAAYKATELNKQLRRGEISEDSYKAAMEGFKAEYDSARQGLIDMKLEENIKLVKEEGAKKGAEVQVAETAEEFQNLVKEVDPEFDTEGVEGVYAGKGNIIINKETARKQGAISVASHEFLHPILNILVGDKKQQGKIVRQFRKAMTYDQKKTVDKLMRDRGYKPSEYATEYINVFSDALANGQINYEKNIFEKIGDAVVGIFKPIGYENISFEKGQDVYNFIKEYNKSIEQGALTEKAAAAIEGVDLKQDLGPDVQASKKLAPEVSNTVAEKITEIKKVEAKGQELAQQFNKEFIKSGQQQKLENELRQLISPAVEALAESTTKRLYDPIASDQKRAVSRQNYKDALKANWEAMVIREYDSGKQDIETFLSTRGNLRANSLAKELGIEGVTEGGIKADVTEQKALTTEDQTDAKIDEGTDIARREAKLINPVDLIPDKNLREKYRNTVKEKVKDLDTKGLSFKKLKDLAPEVTAELFDIPVKKVTNAAANLSTGDLSAIQNFINKNADILLKLLPEGGIDQNQAASEKLLGTSTGVPKKLLDAFYDPKPRGTKGAGLAIQNKRKGITRREFLETFGIVDGKKLQGLSPRSGEAQAMKGLVSLFGRMMTNTVVRQELSKRKDQELVYNASPKSFDQLGERTGMIFLATNKREAQAYAEMNRGEVKDIYINKAEIATEKEALNTMEELGIDTTKGNLYELIDPRFEGFYIGKEAMDQVTTALSDKGFKAIRYEDGGQVSKTTESIVVFDKSAISETKAEGVEAAVQDIAAGKSALQASRTLAGEMSSEKGNIFWNKQNKNAFKELIKNDPENIGKHFKEVYGGVFSNEDKIIKELKAEYKNWQKLPEENRDVFEEHIIEHIASFGFRSELRNLLGLGKNSLNFRNKKQIESARKALIKLTKELTEEDFMKYLLPTLQSGWGLIGGKYVVSKNSKGYILQEVNEDGTRSIKYHLVSGRKDAINNLLKGVFENETFYDREVSDREAIINGKKITTTVVPKQNANDFTSGKFEKDLQKRKNFAKDQRAGMLKIATALQSLANDGKISSNDIGMILMTFNSNPNTLIRTAAVPENKFDGQFSENTEFVYEHSKPAREVLVQLAELISKNKLNDKSYANIMKDYIVTILPKAYDVILNKYYKDFSPVDKNGNYLKSTTLRPARYFNDIVQAAFAAAGLPPLKLIPLGKKPTRKVVLQPSRGKQSQREKTLDKQFNDILENKTGIASDKEYSEAKAKVVGANKGKFNWFIPPTAEDFVGLLYQFLGKGALGDKQMAWFKVNLLDPYAKAMSAVSRDRNTLARNYRALKKELKIVPKNLKKEVPGEGFTVEQAVRVYIWTKQGYDIPGLSAADAKPLREYINSKPELKEFADKLILLNKNEYAKPKSGWDTGTITTDMLTALSENVRAAHLKEWQENVDVIFSEKNLNKIEAAYGPTFRYALENVLTRMKTGRNRTYGADSLTGRLTDWLTNSIGAIMFFNTRSAILQTISSVNFINFSDNNLLAAGKAFSNQKQFWSDFLQLWNSDFLVDRRDGLRLNVNESDIADMAKKGGVRGVISELLKLGFTPTQLADSFAIAVGGATFYRNRVKTYLKQGLDQKAAEEKAFQDFRETAEESQQSSRPDKISQQQAGPLGRIILAFANTPAQYARLMKKAFMDLKNGRGDAKTNISKLIYYGAVQNLVFTAMQQALFGVMFGDEDEEDEDKTKKAINVANGMADSILRGMGISGAIVSVLKNTVKKLIERSEKKSPQYAESAVSELLKISPPISSKASKIKNALRSYEWDKDEMYEKGLALDNPAYLAAGNIVSAATNVPLDRAVKKVTNVKDAMDEDLQLWQRLALLGGWSEWEINLDKKEDKKSRPTIKRKKSLLQRKKTRKLLKK